MKDSLIRKEDAIKALGEEPMVWTDSDFELADRNRWQMDVEALKKLSPVQPIQTNCEYCHTDRDGYVLPLEKNCHAYISRGMHGWVIELKAKGWRGEAKIKYCPICGRRLTDGTD